jgi:hypothetical protein
VEQRLEVVRQLGAAGVPRVHGDEHVAGREQLDGGALEHKGLQVSSHGALDVQDLLCDY